VGYYVAVLLQIYYCICAKNYQNICGLTRLFQKYRGEIFLPHIVVTAILQWYQQYFVNEFNKIKRAVVILGTNSNK